VQNARRYAIVILNVAIFWLVLPASLYGLGWLTDRHLEWARWDGNWRIAPGLTLLVLGAWICVHASVLLKTRGKGLPISALPPTQYVTEGPYRLFRHPIYAGYFYLMEGCALLTGSAGMLFVAVPLFTAVWFNSWVKLYEEPLLLERFGANFRAHSRKTSALLPLPIWRWGRRFVLFLFSLRFPHSIQGRQHLPDHGPFVFVTNHLSYLDFFFGNRILPGRIMIPVTAEVFRRPIKRAFMRFLGAIPKRRFGRDPAASQQMSDQLLAGGIVGIAVEGERSWTGQLACPAHGVATFLSRANCPIVPAVFQGAYQLWPRWAGGSAKGKKVEVHIGPPFALDDVPLEQVDSVVRDRLSALLSPEETSVNITDYPGPRPQLTMWRCPLCQAEESLNMTEDCQLACADCQACWSTADGDLTLTAPDHRAGEKKTVAGWAVEAGTDPVFPSHGPVLETEGVELLQDAQGLANLRPLLSRGKGGKATLHRDRLEWSLADDVQTMKLARVKVVTTERNNTLQLGIGAGVTQLVFDQASPLRWQLYVEGLCKTIQRTESSPSTPTSTLSSGPDRDAP
jgi:1-acyl-sn-glycerol-3-phosphate acyltransferase